MLKQERTDEIMQIMNEDNYVTVEYLAQKMHISPSSVRRDLTYLESRGLIRRSYGGAELVVTDRSITPFQLRMKKNHAEKRRIALCAASLVHEGDVVFLDASTTGQFLLEELVKIRGITIVTNSIEALHFLCAYDVKAISTGGTVNAENRAVLTGEVTNAFWRTVRASIAFFSVQSLDTDGVFYDCYQDEITATREMLRYAKKKVLLCEYDKLNGSSPFVKGTLADVNILVSDKPMTSFFADSYPALRFLFPDSRNNG